MTQPLPSALQYFYCKRVLLFLGCSLKMDRTLKLFAQFKKDGKIGKYDYHFAIVERPIGESDVKTRESDLTNLQIQPLWYRSGRHEDVNTLLKYLVSQCKRVDINRWNHEKILPELFNVVESGNRP
jgi:hypothetical protein